MASPDQSKDHIRRFHLFQLHQRLLHQLKAFMFIDEVPISEKNESVCWKKQTDIVTQQSRLLGTAIKQLDIYVMEYLWRLHQH